MKGAFSIVCFFLISVSLLAQRKVIHCGTLIDGKANEVQSQMTIIVDGNKIASVEKGFSKANENDVLIDLKNKTVMPGLIDMHVHLEDETSRDANLLEFTLNDADIAFRAALHAKKTLMAGFTTVRDL